MMSLAEYIGHLHPVLVHLPIGILLTAILFDWLSRRKGFRKLRKSVQGMLFLGFVSAAMSAFTGYLLSQSGDYDAALLNLHQWLGISVAVLSLVVLLLRRRKEREIKLATSVLMVGLAILIALTGHAGGSLTHGADYLKPPAIATWFGTEREKEFLPADLKSAVLYSDLVAPIIKAKCIRCHGPSRQKGKLRLDQPEFILKGGKDGAVVRVNPWDESEIFKRIHLEPEDEDHMPPKDKSQLSKKQVIILSYWIEAGADFQSKLNTLPRADSIISLLTDPSNQQEGDENIEVAEEIIPFPNARSMEELKNGGVVVSLLGQGNGYITLNFMNADTTHLSALVKELPLLYQQVAELKLTGCRLSHPDWAQLSKLTALTRLYLENANILDEDLDSIRSLGKLEYLNLVGTAVTRSGLEKLRTLPKLKRLFLFHTPIPESDQGAVQQLFPKTKIDFGNYVVPTLPSDTTKLTKPYIVPGK
jgi:uncharacterized membrane protein